MLLLLENAKFFGGGGGGKDKEALPSTQFSTLSRTPPNQTSGAPQERISGFSSGQNLFEPLGLVGLDFDDSGIGRVSPPRNPGLIPWTGQEFISLLTMFK